MAKNYINYDRIELLTTLDSDIPLVNKALKLSEEVGEFSQVMLKHIGSKNVSASAGDNKEDVLEELCDIINISVDIINAMGFTDEEASKMFEKKLDKWEAKSQSIYEVLLESEDNHMLTINIQCNINNREQQVQDSLRALHYEQYNYKVLHYKQIK